MVEQLSLFPEPTVEEKPEPEKEPAPKRSTQVWTVINGQDIPYSFRQSVVQFCGKSCDPARVFYRAMASGAKNPMGWIREGFKKPEEYAFKACKDEYDNPKVVHAWIFDEWNKGTVKGFSSIKDILKEAIK